MPKQRPGRMEVQDALRNYFWGQEAGRERISGCVDELAHSCRCKRLREQRPTHLLLLSPQDMRKHVTMTLLDTEQSYVESLRTLMQVRPMA